MQDEIWKDVVGYEQFYQVSDKGRIRYKKKSQDRQYSLMVIEDLESAQQQEKQLVQRTEEQNSCIDLWQPRLYRTHTDTHT